MRFKYHDNRDGGKEKVMTLEALEFMRRFLLHLLPDRFVRVRHYGLHHSSKRKTLQQCRTLLGLPYALPVVKPLLVVDWLMEVLGHHPNQCPRCGAVMMRRGEFGPLGPVWLWLLDPVGAAGETEGHGLRMEGEGSPVAGRGRCAWWPNWGAGEGRIGPEKGVNPARMSFRSPGERLRRRVGGEGLAGRERWKVHRRRFI